MGYPFTIASKIGQEVQAILITYLKYSLLQEQIGIWRGSYIPLWNEDLHVVCL